MYAHLHMGLTLCDRERFGREEDGEDAKEKEEVAGCQEAGSG